MWNPQDCLVKVVNKIITRVDSRNGAIQNMAKNSKGIWKVVFTEKVDFPIGFESLSFYI